MQKFSNAFSSLLLGVKDAVRVAGGVGAEYSCELAAAAVVWVVGVETADDIDENVSCGKLSFVLI